MRISIKLARSKMFKKKSRKKVRKDRAALKEKIHKILGDVMVVIAIVLVVGVFGGAYYFVIAPNLVSKPFIEKPSLPEDWSAKVSAGASVVNSSHINYIINEIGAYKLRKMLWTKDYPIMEFLLTDVDERYYSFVKDNMPVTKLGNAMGENIVISGTQQVVFEILESDHVMLAVREANNNGKIQVELISDMKTLAKKGYLSIYDNLK